MLNIYRPLARNRDFLVSLAGALGGGVVTLWMTVRLAQRLGTGRGRSDISFAAEQSRA
jgi:hypothetical protein